MLNRKYNRIFILLNGKNEGLAANLNGSCDIEIINGKVRLYSYVGGIGRLKSKKRYLYLMCCTDDTSKAVRAGEFEIKGSNAVLETEIEPDDILGSGVAIESINAAAVWSKDEGPAKAVLDGFVSKKYAWNRNLTVYDSRTEHSISVRDIQPKDENVSHTAPKTEPISENAQKDEETQLQAAETAAYISPHDTFREIAEKFRRELDILDKMGIVDKDSILGKADDSKENDIPTIEEVNVSTKKTETMPIKGDKEEFKPESDMAKQPKDLCYADRLFEREDKISLGGSAEWVRIDYREAYMLPVSLDSVRNIFARNCARKGKHAILGRNNGKYYIGVPGGENMSESANVNGFYDFLTLGGDNEAGYWIKSI